MVKIEAMGGELAAVWQAKYCQKLTDWQLDRMLEAAGSWPVLLKKLGKRKRPDKVISAENVIGKWQPEYPQKLNVLPGMPWLLFTRGNVELLAWPTVAIVGSRHTTVHGRQEAAIITRQFVKAGFATISGLALGIDTVVHQVTLAEKGQTLAVLAGGLDSVYPAANRQLAEDIISHEGLWLSEQPSGTPPLKPYFLARNRIVVALADYVVIVEAGLVSGSMASANWAAELGKPLLAIPGSPGTDLLLHEGALAADKLPI